MVSFYDIEKQEDKSHYIPYATLCSTCHRLRSIWSKTKGIVMAPECYCTMGIIRSDQGNGIYDGIYEL